MQTGMWPQAFGGRAVLASRRRRLLALSPLSLRPPYLSGARRNHSLIWFSISELVARAVNGFRLTASATNQAAS
jgi:hypothetical protein